MTKKKKCCVPHLDRVLKFVVSGGGNSLEHVLADEWNDALLPFLLLAHHGIGLARTRLPICEDAHVVSWK